MPITDGPKPAQQIEDGRSGGAPQIEGGRSGGAPLGRGVAPAGVTGSALADRSEGSGQWKRELGLARPR